MYVYQLLRNLSIKLNLYKLYRTARSGLVSRQEAESEILLIIPAPDRDSIFPKSSGSERIQIHIRYTTLPRNQQCKEYRTAYLQRTVHSRAPLKVPKRENFSLAFFALSEPIWVFELGTDEKKSNF